MEMITDQVNSIIQPIGRIDANTSSSLEATLTSFVNTGKDLILDLSQCVYLSSAGIRILLKAKKTLLQSQNELYIVSPPADVYQVFEIAGLLKLFQFENSLETAKKKINKIQKPSQQTIDFQIGGKTFVYTSTGLENCGAFWKGPDIVSFKELGLSMGIGPVRSLPGSVNETLDFFMTTDSCVGFYELENTDEADFRISSNPTKNGFPISEAISFGNQPAGFLRLSAPSNVSLDEVQDAVRLIQKLTKADNCLTLVIVASLSKSAPAIKMYAVMEAENLAKSVVNCSISSDGFFFSKFNGSKFGIQFELDNIEEVSLETDLQDFLLNNLSFENISEIAKLNESQTIENPFVWLFNVNQLVDGNMQRIQIETVDGFSFETHQSFLTRQLFTDASRLKIEPLHGGFSAQTFHVTSFDHDGRKMRPTVMKVAHRDLIERESDRCSRYALPYIFNNSAVVLGAEFYGETGALRYNFVGIGGESSQLKWLTHYYHQKDIAYLKPLFDKIFLQILKPWYGQPVIKTIQPFEDHDPTYTFFPHIYDTVKDVFSISSDEPEIFVAETGRNMLNPYWFLKHEYPKRRDKSMQYPTGICHGDLNMQNILLDETMNVYLIDFSETRQRSVVSDFARLEAILLIDNAPLETEADMKPYLDFIESFYNVADLHSVSPNIYTGFHREKVAKNHALALKMRNYAYESTHQNADPIPYYLALLEWVLPIVCYGIPIPQRRLSMIVASLLCEKVMKADF
jgi:anti-anti-sigma factor